MNEVEIPAMLARPHHAPGMGKHGALWGRRTKMSRSRWGEEHSLTYCSHLAHRLMCSQYLVTSGRPLWLPHGQMAPGGWHLLPRLATVHPEGRCLLRALEQIDAFSLQRHLQARRGLQHL